MDVKDLTKGVIHDIHCGKTPESFVLQVLAARKFPTGDRSRLLVSDGVHSSGFAILATQLSHLVTNQKVAPNAIVEIKRYFCNDVQNNKKMMIVLEMDVLKEGTEVGRTLGNPIMYEKSNEAKNSTPVKSSSSSTTSRPPLAPHNSSGAPAASVKSEAPLPVAPANMPNVRKIDSLTPYQNKWTICARVTMKTPIRTWSKSSGEGKLFSMNLLDDSSEIRATAFNAECDRFYDMIEPYKVYFISSARLKTANKQFSNLSNEYEMTLSSETNIVPCKEEAAAIPAMQYNFVSLAQLESVEKDSIVDMVAVCKEANELSSVTQRSTGRELTKRDITLVDNTNKSVNMTLWGDQAKNFDGSSNPVLAIKGAKVSDFGGVSLSLLMSSTMQINPDINEAHQLKGWWEQTGCTSSDIVSMSGNRGGAQSTANMQLKNFTEVADEGLGCNDQPDYFSVKATVLLIKKENLMYMACPSEQCNKKVTDMSNGMFRCEKCNKEFDSYKWRYMLQANIGDYTSHQWVTLFQDTAETLMGIGPQELAAKREENPDDFQEYIYKRSFSEYIFKCRVKMETYNDEKRLKTSVMSIYPLNYREYNKKLISDIKAMSQ